MTVQASFSNWGSKPKASTLTQSLKTPVWQEKVPRDRVYLRIFFFFFLFMASMNSMCDLSSLSRD